VHDVSLALGESQLQSRFDVAAAAMILAVRQSAFIGLENTRSCRLASRSDLLDESVCRLHPVLLLVTPSWSLTGMTSCVAENEYGTNITAGIASIGLYVLAMEIPSLTGPEPMWTASESSTWAAMHYRGLSTNRGSS